MEEFLAAVAALLYLLWRFISWLMVLNSASEFWLNYTRPNSKPYQIDKFKNISSLQFHHILQFLPNFTILIKIDLTIINYHYYRYYGMTKKAFSGKHRQWSRCRQCRPKNADNAKLIRYRQFWQIKWQKKAILSIMPFFAQLGHFAIFLLCYLGPMLPFFFGRCQCCLITIPIMGRCAACIAGCSDITSTAEMEEGKWWHLLVKLTTLILPPKQHQLSSKHIKFFTSRWRGHLK